MIGGVIILGAVAISQMIKSTVDEFRAEEADPEDPIPRRETDNRRNRDRDPDPDPDPSPWDSSF